MIPAQSWPGGDAAVRQTPSFVSLYHPEESLPSSSARSLRRALAKRDMTVPIGTSSVRAASS